MITQNFPLPKKRGIPVDHLQDFLLELGKILWNIADQLRGAISADDFCDHMPSFLFLRYLSDNYVDAAKKEFGGDFPEVAGASSSRFRVTGEQDAPPTIGGDSRIAKQSGILRQFQKMFPIIDFAIVVVGGG